MGRILYKGSIPTDSGRNDAPREKNAVKCNACHSIIAYNSSERKTRRFGYNNVTISYYLDCPVCQREINFDYQTEVYDIPPASATREYSGKAKCFKCKAKFNYGPSDVLLKEDLGSSETLIICPQCNYVFQFKYTVYGIETYVDDE